MQLHPESRRRDPASSSPATAAYWKAGSSGLGRRVPPLRKRSKPIPTEDSRSSHLRTTRPCYDQTYDQVRNIDYAAADRRARKSLDPIIPTHSGRVSVVTGDCRLDRGILIRTWIKHLFALYNPPFSLLQALSQSGSCTQIRCEVVWVKFADGDRGFPDCCVAYRAAPFGA